MNGDSDAVEPDAGALVGSGAGPPPSTNPARRRRRRPPTSSVVTIEEVARLAGVSVATVSRALRGLPNVSPDARRRVEAAAIELDYHIDRTASRLATGRSETVGVVVPLLTSWYFGAVVAGIETTLAAHGLDVILTSITDEAARHRLASGNAPLRKRVDGLIFVDVMLTAEEIEALARSPLRVVTVGQRTGRFPSVTIDDRGAAREATRHLLDLGHRRIALILGEPATDLPFLVPTERREGYREALIAAGVEPASELIVATGPTAGHGADAARALLDLDDPPTAIFAVSDELATGVVLALRALGLGTPDDVSVVGFDDQELSAVLGLTTVWQDAQDQGRMSAQLLLEADAGPVARPPHEMTAPSHMVVRQSTAAPVGAPH